MDFPKALSYQAFNLNKTVQKDYKSHVENPTEEGWDADRFFELTMQKTATNALYQEIGRNEYQSLKTTIESFQ